MINNNHLKNKRGHINIKEVEISQRQGEFLKDFFKKDTKRYILGINKYSDSLYCALIEKA